jgi:predicted nucleic acid-binding protein
MKSIIVDTNIIFSALRSKDSHTRAKLLTSRHKFYTPNFLIVEIFKHKKRIVQKAKTSDEEIFEFLNKTLQKIHFVSEELIAVEHIITAYHLCKDVDEKDTPFIALAIEMEAELWTRDQELKEGLLRKGFNRFFDENEEGV